MIPSFIQPIMLAALPLAALPIVIHLINRQRHRTVAWGAMMFLLDAKRMTRGIARLRYWLIMAMRMLAIATLVFAVARPLASGRMGLALGGAPETTIIVLDRSASMQQQDVQTGETKRAAALAKLAELLETLGRSSRVVLIENTQNRPLPVESTALLTELPSTAPTDTASDVPAMLQTALDYIVTNQVGRTDVWICSDMQAGDWRKDDGRWAGLREGFAKREGVRFYVLSYPAPAAANLAIRVESARVGLADQSTQLILDVVVRRAQPSARVTEVPIEFVINGARSVVRVEMSDVEHRLQGHTVALAGQARSGWGYVELPADANMHDNRYYFVFGDPPRRHTIMVSDRPRVARPVQLAALAPVDPGLSYTAEVVTPSQAAGADWDTAALVVWQAPLPDGELAQRLNQFVEEGRPVFFFPPIQPTNTSWAGFRWVRWQDQSDAEPLQMQTWRSDSGLLQSTRGGASLPVGKLQVYRYCTIEGDGQALATLSNGETFLRRGSLGNGSFYFCATLPRATESSLLRDGVTFYVMLHRALEMGAATRSKVKQLDAGSPEAHRVADWKLLSEPPARSLSSDRSLFAAVFQYEDELAALNRPLQEDRHERIDQEQAEALFEGLNVRIVEEEIGSASALASEVWRAFVFLMAVALIVEAVLCLPDRELARREGPGLELAGQRA